MVPVVIVLRALLILILSRSFLVNFDRGHQDFCSGIFASPLSSRRGELPQPFGPAVYGTSENDTLQLDYI